ncbi:hypothetical protein [Nocardia sp. NPDC052566]|uniref:hypothetical protein n=1 Tax=Nocardia sp. NPDC052566 TaxID=3364330 RepID=UPI0037CBD71A
MSIRAHHLLTLLAIAALSASACADDADPGPAARPYLGKWNYDQPDSAAAINMATLELPNGPQRAPQIGDVVYTLEPGNTLGDTVIGRTDVGCTWRFRVDRDAMRLDPPAQLCHNPTSNIAYTITSWTATVSGNHMSESITAKSHRPDRDLDFALEKGARTRTAEADAAGVAAFVGTWTYDPAEPATRRNLRTIRGPGPGITEIPERGAVTITADYDNRITARTSDGCAWTLLTRGNTAKLDPPVQTCPRPAGATITLRSWTIATDGRRQDAALMGTDESGAAFALMAGNLTKAQQTSRIPFSYGRNGIRQENTPDGGHTNQTRPLAPDGRAYS